MKDTKAKVEDMPLDAPFRIAQRWPDGNLKDWTIYKLTGFHSNNRSVDIYFRPEGFFVNPPTDTPMDYRIKQKIYKYGVEFVSEREFNEIRKEFGHDAMTLNFQESK